MSWKRELERLFTYDDWVNREALRSLRDAPPRRLMSEIASRLCGASYPALIVWTQPQNARARCFYERLGGVYVRTRPSGPFESVGYGWPDVRVLVAPEAPSLQQL